MKVHDDKDCGVCLGIKRLDLKLKLTRYLLEGDTSCVDVDAVNRNIDIVLDKRLLLMEQGCNHRKANGLARIYWNQSAILIECISTKE